MSKKHWKPQIVPKLNHCSLAFLVFRKASGISQNSQKFATELSSKESVDDKVHRGTDNVKYVGKVVDCIVVVNVWRNNLKVIHV
jgi:hypothetical protein